MKNNSDKSFIYIKLSVLLFLCIYIYVKVIVMKPNLIERDNISQKCFNIVRIFFENKKILDVQLINQLPELKNGCEVTSLTMALNYKGIVVDKMILASNVAKDSTQLVINEDGNIVKWGNPIKGFVGDITGKNKGYSIDPEPLISMIENYYKNGVNNISGLGISEIERAINNNNPVVVWINADFVEEIKWINWYDSEGNMVKANINMHCVLVTGYDKENIFYNDPLREEKNKCISKEIFINVWNSMGKKALEIGEVKK